MRPRTPSVLLAAALAGVLVLPGGVALAGGNPGKGGKGKAPATSPAERPSGPAADARERPAPRPASKPRPRPVPFSLVGHVVTADPASVTVAVRNASGSVRALRGTTVRIPVATGTKVVKNGRRVSPALLAPGDRISTGGVRYGTTLVTRRISASGRWAARPVAPGPDTVSPSPDTVSPTPDSRTP